MVAFLKRWWWLLLAGLVWAVLKFYTGQQVQTDPAEQIASSPPTINPQLQVIKQRTQQGNVACGNFARVGCENIVTYTWTSAKGGVETDQVMFFGAVVTVQNQFTVTNDMICSDVSTADILWERNQSEALVQQYVIGVKNFLHSIGSSICKKYTGGEAGIYKVHYHTGNSIENVKFNPVLEGDEVEFFELDHVNLREIGNVN